MAGSQKYLKPGWLSWRHCLAHTCAVFCHCVLIQDSYSKWASEQPPWVTWSSFSPGGRSTLMNSPTNSKWGGRASSPKENQDRVTEQGNGKAELAKICFYYRTLLFWFWHHFLQTGNRSSNIYEYLWDPGASAGLWRAMKHIAWLSTQARELSIIF